MSIFNKKAFQSPAAQAVGGERTKKKKSRAPEGFEGEMPKLDKKIVFRMLKLFAPYKLQLALAILCVLASTFATVYGMMFIQTLIDDYIAPLAAQVAAGGVADFSGLLKVVLKVGCIFAGGIVTQFVSNLIMVLVSQRIMRDVRNDMFAHMQSLPIKYFDTNSNGDIMSRYTNDTDTLHQLVSQSVPSIASSLVTVITVFVAMLMLSWQLTIFVVVSAVLMLLITKKVADGSARFFSTQQKALGDLNGYIEEMIHGQKVIKVFCHEEQSKQGFDKRNEELCYNATSANKYINVLGPIMGNLGHVQYVLIAVIGGAIAVLSAEVTGAAILTLGTIASFLQLSQSFTGPINNIAQQMGGIVTAMVGAERVFSIIDAEPEHDEGYVTLVHARHKKNGKLVESKGRTKLWAWKHPHGDGSVSYTELKGDVRLSEVDFAYEEGKPVLHDITLYAEPGQKVAFVGATGAGKTTITNLINRFYDIADGKVRYDGININKICKSDLRRSLGVVLQDVNLFTGTVMENIRYGRLDATDREVIEAAKQANAYDFIMRLPQGFDTMLDSDGANLSQGQRQLLSIARAAVADPPVMILDEATSSIDTRTESLVQKGMDKLMEGRTVFVIAHRLSTVQNSDVIMVLEHGRIIERGSHESLIAQKGKYYQLYTGAFELE